MLAYKVFNPDWTCRGFKYQVGKTYEDDIKPSVCDRGFHFCKKLADCFNYYTFDPNNKVAKIEALGNIAEGGDKCCTNKIKIVKEITWHEVLDLVNTGKGNTGLGNSGDRNTGNGNTGYWNSGNLNTGIRNTGNGNTGYYNSGYRNSGYFNVGRYNSGDRNTGGRNTGDRNTGNLNTGDYNSGDFNTGHRNTGDRNIGNGNTGDYNSGDCNSGDFNLSDNNAGCFNVDDHKLIFFDQETELTWYQWRNSRAYALLCNIDSQPTQWICADDMTDQEKSNYPSYKTTGGYLKKRDIGEACKEWWDQLSDDQEQCIRRIPNFDAKKFEMITGINTEESKKSKITKTKLIGMYLSEKEPEEFFNGFTARGIVENVFKNEENEETNIKIGFPAEEWDKEAKDNVKVIHYVNVILPDDVEHEDIDEGYDITVKGQILNAATQKRDKYGEIIDGEIKRGNYIEVVTKVDDNPDTEKYDDIKSGNYEDDKIDVAEEKPKKAKSKKIVEKPVKKKKEEVISLDEDDDYDDLEEDVDF